MGRVLRPYAAIAAVWLLGRPGGPDFSCAAADLDAVIVPVVLLGNTIMIGE